MAKDPRITTATVVHHMTPDGRRHDSEAEAERHLARLDKEARDERLRSALESAFWDSRELQERHRHDSFEFANGMVGFLNHHIDDIRALVPIMPAIEEAWAGPTAPAAPEAEPVTGSERSSRRPR